MGTAVVPVAAALGVAPTQVAGFSVTLTVPSVKAGGFLTAYPSGKSRPVTAALNFDTGVTLSNATVVPADGTGAVALYNGSARPLDVVIDVGGWFRASPDVQRTGGFLPVGPLRSLDTRNGIPVPAHASQNRNAYRCTDGADTVDRQYVNVTVVRPQASGWIKIRGRFDEAGTLTSTTTFVAGETRSTFAIVRASSGIVTIENGSAGPLHVVVDIVGCQVASPTEINAPGQLSYADARLLDTRSGHGAPRARVAGGSSVDVLTAGLAGLPPAQVAAVAVAVSAVGASAPGYVTAWPGRTTRPVVSQLTQPGRRTVTGFAIVPVGKDGRIDLYVGSSGATDLVVDIVGWYAGAPTLPSDAAVVTSARQNAAHDGVAPELPADLTQRWSVDLPPGVDYAVADSARVYVATSGYGVAGGNGEPAKVWALSTADGHTVWGPQPVSENGDDARLALSGNRLFAANSSGLTTAVRIDTGTVLWTATTPGDQDMGGITASDGLLFVPGSFSITALDQTTGAQRFARYLGDGAEGAPAVADGALYMTGGCGFTTRMDLTGRIVWARQGTCSSSYEPVPVVSGDAVWDAAEANATTAARRLTNGTQIAVLPGRNTPAVVQSVAVTSTYGDVAATNLASGDTLWTRYATETSGSVVTAPLISGRTVYVGHGTGTIRGYDLFTGTEVWSGDTGAQFTDHDAATVGALAVTAGCLLATVGPRVTAFCQQS